MTCQCYNNAINILKGQCFPFIDLLISRALSASCWHRINFHTYATTNKSPSLWETLRGHRMQNSLYKLFEHKCELEVCTHIHLIMIKKYILYSYFKIPFLRGQQSSLAFNATWTRMACRKQSWFLQGKSTVAERAQRAATSENTCK